MNQGLRAQDRLWPKKLWDMGTPWIQIVGFIVMSGFVGGIYFSKYQAYADTLAIHSSELAEQGRKISALENNYAVINQKLDDIKNYLIPGH